MMKRIGIIFEVYYFLCDNMMDTNRFVESKLNLNDSKMLRSNGGSKTNILFAHKKRTGWIEIFFGYRDQTQIPKLQKTNEKA